MKSKLKELDKTALEWDNDIKLLEEKVLRRVLLNLVLG